MGIPGKHKDFGKSSKIVTKTYRGPDRRNEDSKPDDPQVSRKVTFDDKGNPRLDVRTEAARRRVDDKTVDLLKCLDADGPELKLSED